MIIIIWLQKLKYDSLMKKDIVVLTDDELEVSKL